MPVTLTIKQVPDELAKRLREVAARNHRSLQGELMHSLELIVASHDHLNRVEPIYGIEITTPGPDTISELSNNLSDELAAIVAGSNWGKAPLLSREQANDRTLTREIDYLAQENRAKYRR